MGGNAEGEVRRREVSVTYGFAVGREAKWVWRRVVREGHWNRTWFMEIGGGAAQ